MHDIIIFTPQFLIPVCPRAEVYSDRAVIVKRGRITGIEPVHAALQQHPEAERIDLPHHVLLPGLINMHTHSAMSLLRGYADDMALDQWLHEHIWPAEQRWMDQRFVQDGTELAIAEMLMSGTTCFNEMYFFPEVIAKAADRAGMRACVGAPIVDFSTAWADDFETCLDKGLSLHSDYRGHERIMTALAPHSPYTVNDAMLTRIRESAEQHDMPVHMHVLETAWELEQSRSEYGKTPIARLRDAGLLNTRLLAAHMIHLSREDIDMVAQSGAHVIHCPESNLKLASGHCRVAELISAGINLTVGTDGAASNNNLNLLGELRTAALLAKGVARDAGVMDAARAIETITINAARALGLESEIGSIKPGKSADFCAIDLRHPQTQPIHHVLSQVVYAASAGQVSDVWVRGTPLLRNKNLLTIELDDVLSRAADWNETMRPGARSKDR